MQGILDVQYVEREGARCLRGLWVKYTPLLRQAWFNKILTSTCHYLIARLMISDRLPGKKNAQNLEMRNTKTKQAWMVINHSVQVNVSPPIYVRDISVAVHLWFMALWIVYKHHGARARGCAFREFDAFTTNSAQEVGSSRKRDECNHAQVFHVVDVDVLCHGR